MLTSAVKAREACWEASASSWQWSRDVESSPSCSLLAVVVEPFEAVTPFEDGSLGLEILQLFCGEVRRCVRSHRCSD